MSSVRTYFSLLVLVQALTSMAMAQSLHQSLVSGAPAPSFVEPSASVFIRFNEGLHMNFRDGRDLGRTRATLGPGSVVQIPSQIAKFNPDGTINLNATMEYWLEFAQYQRQNQGGSHLAPRAWDCGAAGSTRHADGRCQGVVDGELFFPIKVVRAPGTSLDLNGSDSYGYLALDYLRNNIDPSRYQTVHTTIENAIEFPEQTTPETQVLPGDSGYAGDGSETTRPEATTAAAAPPAAPPAAQPPAAGRSEIFNCNNTRYRSSREGFAKNSCLASWSLEQRASLVMRDVLEINRLRPSFNLDPRFSVCVAFRESNLHPNARGGTPDWGMYQVIDSTGRGALRRNNPVTPGFSQYRYNWNQYRDTMIRSTLAQADLHHSVLKEKADANGLLNRINSGSSDVALYRTLATRYNGSGPRATRYGNRVSSCYQAMLKVATRDGRITNPAGLQAALNRALD